MLHRRFPERRRIRALATGLAILHLLAMLGAFIEARRSRASTLTGDVVFFVASALVGYIFLLGLALAAVKLIRERGAAPE